MVKIKGDLRYRHEMIDQETKDQVRHRQRIRARVNVEAKANDTVKLYFRLASGSDDPVSTNQTLDGGFSTKNWGLDLAYFDIVPSSLAGMHLMGGKMKNPFHKSSLIWDGDLTPEGLALRYSPSTGTIEPVLSVGYFWVEERSQNDDSFLMGGEAAMKMNPGTASFHAGAGYYQFTEAKGRAPFFDPGDNFGNCLDAQGTYETDFTEIHVFAELGMMMVNLPVKMYGSFVTNTQADEDNQGFLAGLGIGKAKVPGSYEINYNYRKLEADAVVGAYTDSDPWGGGTDGEGHQFVAKYQLGKNFQLAGTYFLTKQGIEDGTDYGRFQGDLVFKF
jgi:hypothetical protein